ncbi:MAG: resolvase [Elainellaceae cyanobacterium]
MTSDFSSPSGVSLPDLRAQSSAGRSGVDEPKPGRPDVIAQSLKPEDYECLTVEDVQDALGRSRASIYRYANTTPETLNPPFDRRRLNPELRKHKDAPLVFHPSEVERFARDILGIQHVTIEVQVSEQTVNQSLLRQILDELKGIRRLLEATQDDAANGPT